jgi:hypothetical protein
MLLCVAFTLYQDFRAQSESYDSTRAIFTLSSRTTTSPAALTHSPTSKHPYILMLHDCTHLVPKMFLSATRLPTSGYHIIKDSQKEDCKTMTHRNFVEACGSSITSH